MPETYTHVRIARRALARVRAYCRETEVDLKTVDPIAFIWGASGPDPLFAYRFLSPRKDLPVPELGSRMHREHCTSFLCRLVKDASTDLQKSYALGFLTHHAADATFHPYVAYQCSKHGQFAGPNGHGFCEVALDSYFHLKDHGSPVVPCNAVTPFIPGQTLLEITGLLQKTINTVFEEGCTQKTLITTFHDFRALHLLLRSKHGVLSSALRPVEDRLLHDPGFARAHMTPGKIPKEGFMKHWQNLHTGQWQESGPEQLNATAIRLAFFYILAADSFWNHNGSLHALSEKIGDRRYE